MQNLIKMVFNQAIKLCEADEKYEVCQQLLNYSNSNQMDIDLIKFDRINLQTTLMDEPLKLLREC